MAYDPRPKIFSFPTSISNWKKIKAIKNDIVMKKDRLDIDIDMDMDMDIKTDIYIYISVCDLVYLLCCI